MDIPELWKRLEDWLTKNASHIKNELNKAATTERISQLEQVIGTALPKDYKAFLMIHDGQNRDSDGLIDTEELLSTDRIVEEWKVWKGLLNNGEFDRISSDPEKGIKKDWWNPQWIPITYDGSGNHYCIDLDPNAEGTKGQIIRMWHDDSERTLVADSFKEWISNYVLALEKGKYIYAEDWGGVINKDDL